MQKEYNDDVFSADIGPDAIVKMVAAVNLEDMIDKLEIRIETASTPDAQSTLERELEVGNPFARSTAVLKANSLRDRSQCTGRS